MLTYEEKLNQDVNGALHEGDLYFARRSSTHNTLRRLAKILTDIRVEYAVIGTMAMFYHGFRRFTEGVDMIVTPKGLARFVPEISHFGFTGPKNERIVRDAENGVKVVFFTSGDGPPIHGLGRLQIPHPNDICETIDGLSFASLPALIDLKLAVGQASHRLKDLGDVQQLVQHLKLTPEFAEQLDPSLRDEYRRIWGYAQRAAADDY